MMMMISQSVLDAGFAKYIDETERRISILPLLWMSGSGKYERYDRKHFLQISVSDTFVNHVLLCFSMSRLKLYCPTALDQMKMTTD